MCRGPLISTRLIIRSADVWVRGEGARRQGVGMNGGRRPPPPPPPLSHTELCVCGGSPVVARSPEEFQFKQTQAQDEGK